ncbi:V-type ATPase 116kDa subunit family protein [uncultured archaeon]|nr:V-type ATPase 116kDa subunit family protein [uncultured archaeon]
MLKPVPLEKVYLVGIRSVQPDALRLWQKLGVVHISPVPAGQSGLHEGESLPDYQQVSEQLVRIRAILSQLTPLEGDATLSRPVLEAARSVAIEDTLRLMAEEQASIQKQLGGRREREKQLHRIQNVPFNLSTLPPQLSYSLFCAQTPQLEKAQARIKKHLKHAQVLSVPDGNDATRTLLLIAAPASADLSAATEGLERVAWPADLSGAPKAALLMEQSASEALNERLRALARRRRELSLKYYPLCKRLEEALSVADDLSRVSSGYMRQSSSCFFSQGWVHPKEMARLRSETEKAFGSQVLVRPLAEHEHHGHGRPTLLENPGVAAPSQFLVEFLGTPRADEIDPTLITFFTVPILYGLIVGDAGYALISFILALAMRLKSKKDSMLYHFAGLWTLGAIPSFIFGVLFDEYFGYSHYVLLHSRLYEGVVHRVEDVSGLLLLTIIVGWVHIALGFLLGAANEWNHNRKHAYAKLAWLPIQIGGTLAVAYFLLNAVPADLGLGGVAMAVIGAGILAWAEGPLGLVEIPGLASNIMSYARIAAVGVAGVILAEAINTLISPNPALLDSPMGILLFVFVAVAYVLAHVFNTAVAMFEGVIHGARLNVVEFFGKFYKGGGTRFTPLSEKNRVGM